MPSQQRRRIALAGSLLAAAVAIQSGAQSPQEAKSAKDRAFVYVAGSSMNTFSGEWSGMAPLLRYTKSHSGTYVVFSEGGALYRLDTPALMTDLERTLAPMRELEAKQKVLAAEQKPLATQQRSLGAQQRAATDPETMGRVGAVQGAIGQEQGAIGRVQGEIGRRQGEIGRVFGEKVQTMISACLADRSCPRVESETASR